MDELVFKWEYFDRAGNKLGHVNRLSQNSKNSPKGPKKQYMPFFKKGQKDGEFEWGIPNELKYKKPIYGIHKITQWHMPVYVVEGEKCVNALNSLGFQAITTLGGSNNVAYADWNSVKELKEIIILPDNDTPGECYKNSIIKEIRRVIPDIKIRVFSLPNLDSKGDVCDWLKTFPQLKDWNEYQPLNEFEGIIEIAKVFKELQITHSTEMPSDHQYTVGKGGLRAIDMKSFLTMQIKPNEVLLSPWITEQSLSLVFAERGVGKTFFALNCAIALTHASEFLRYKAENPVKVMYIDGEMQDTLMQERLRATLGEREPNELLSIINPGRQFERGMPDISTTEGQIEVDELIEAHGSQVIIVDNLSTLARSGKENEGESWSNIQSWAIKHRSRGRAILFIHHANKSGEQRGTSRKEDVLDNAICLKRPDDYDEGRDGAKFEITFTKSRSLYGDDTKPIEANLITKDGESKWVWSYVDNKMDRAIEMLGMGMNQTEVAETLGVNKSTVCRWDKKSRSH